MLTFLYLFVGLFVGIYNVSSTFVSGHTNVNELIGSFLKGLFLWLPLFIRSKYRAWKQISK